MEKDESIESSEGRAFGEKFQQLLEENNHLARAIEYYQEKEYATAKMFLEMVINEEPTVDVYHLLAIVEERCEGELGQVVSWLNKALEMDPDSPDLYSTLGNILVKRKQFQGAINAFEKTLKFCPDHPDARHGIGTSLMHLKQYGEAENTFRKVLECYPDHPGALQNLSLALKELDRQQESLDISSQLLALYESAEACNNHGTILTEMNRNEEARQYFERAIELDPEYAPAYCNAGLMMLGLGEPELAIAHYKYAITLDDQDPSFYHNLAFAYFSVKKYGKGWDVFRHRKLVKNVMSYTDNPEWEGESLRGKKIFITAEQGLGDEIMFASTIPDLSNEEGEVTLQCDPRLSDLYQRSFPKVKVLGVERKDISRVIETDYENAIGDLPRFYRRSLEDFPVRGGYLIPDPQKVLYWKKKLDELGDELKIGICWRSGTTEKIRKHQLHSVAEVRYFYPLLDIAGVTTISLQYTDVTDEIKLVYKERGRKVVLLEEIDMKNDQDELAALMVALDLTISVGTAVQQMAAAVKDANVWSIPANTTPFHRLMKTPVPEDIDTKERDDEESFIAQVTAATSILTEATQQMDPSAWITELCDRKIEDGRLYPAT